MVFNPGLQADPLRAALARELYQRLPEVYRARDWQRALGLYGEAVSNGQKIPELEAFLGIMADEIIRMRQHIGDLWDDFFIETCADWAVPYIADLLGVRLVFNAAQRNRVDVKNTVGWRRRKGSLSMLADLAGDVTGWHAASAEFLETLGWSQNLNHIKLDHCQAPDVRDGYQLSLIGTARDCSLHAIDVRLPQGQLGWYGIKKLGFFMSRLNAYPLRGVVPDRPADAPQECFTFSPLGRDLPVFNQTTRQPVTAAEFARDPYAFFGQTNGFSIRQHGILIASSTPRPPESTEAKIFWSGFGPASPGEAPVQLDSTAGLQLMQPELFSTPMRRFKITALWGNDFAASVALGAVVTYPAKFVRTAAAASPGVMMLRIELDSGSDAAVFPACVLAIRNDRTAKRAADSRESRYRDALYVYLPEAALTASEELNLYIAADGSTFYAKRNSPHLGASDPTPSGILTPDPDRQLRARAGLGQCFPPRRLTYSLDSSDLVDLHRTAGMRLADEALFQSANRQFLIEAYMYTEHGGDLIGQLPTYNQATADPNRSLNAFCYRSNANAAIDPGGRVVVKVSRSPLSTEDLFPMTELILTERSGRALLVALPEMDFSSNAEPVWLFFDSEGASYYASSNFGHDNALGRPERGSAFRFEPADPASGLARKSAGQVLGIPGAFPLRQREPVYADLCYWDHPKPRPLRSGQVGIDPVRGRFCFFATEVPPAPLDNRPLGLSVDYYEGFAYDVGALPYDRYLTLKSPENKEPTCYVALSGDTEAGSKPVFATLGDALNSARDGEVIQIADSATYEQTSDLVIPVAARRLAIQAANRQRPCLRFQGCQFKAPGAMDALRLNGLLISGAPLVITEFVRQVDLVGCSFDPVACGLALVASQTNGSKANAQINVCRCIMGGFRLGPGVVALVATDSIFDGPGDTVIGDLGGHETSAVVQLERVTAWGEVYVHSLYASECLFVDRVVVGDRQDGCVRYTRYQLGSSLPRRFHCVPAGNSPRTDPLVPAFNSHRFGRPDYAQLHHACPAAITAGAENGSEMGAFQGALTVLRKKNLELKFEEYVPVGLTPAIIFVT